MIIVTVVHNVISSEIYAVFTKNHDNSCMLLRKNRRQFDIHRECGMYIYILFTPRFRITNDTGIIIDCAMLVTKYKFHVRYHQY